MILIWNWETAVNVPKYGVWTTKKVQCFSANIFFGWISIFLRKVIQIGIFYHQNMDIQPKKNYWKILNIFCSPCIIFWHIFCDFSVSNQNHKKLSLHKLAEYHSFHMNQKKIKINPVASNFFWKTEIFSNLKKIYIFCYIYYFT